MVKKISKIKQPKKLKKGEVNTNIDSFRHIQNIFENNIFLHEISIKEIGKQAQKYDSRNLKPFLDILKNKAKENKKHTKDKIKLKFSKSELRNASQVFENVIKTQPLQAHLFSKNTIVSMVSTIDILLSKLFSFYYKKYPKKLSLENQSIRFEELENIENVEEAQKFLIDREIETLLIEQGLDRKLKVLRKDMALNLDPINKNLEDLKKLIKIRNLIVHNEGRMDKEYIKKYGDKKSELNKDIIIADKYLNDSLLLLYFIGTYIIQEAQLNFSEEIKKKNFLLINPLHYLVKHEQYHLLRPIYNFISNPKINASEKKYIVINYCTGLKKQGKKLQDIEKVLELEDWSLTRDDFDMCKAALLDKHTVFYKYLKKLIKAKTVGKEEIDDWAIFAFYKNKSEFKSIIKNAK
ncbi:MAG: hypothetical protein UX71_C0001G0104 [Parcubacteria group bacterium GW2011_GWA1_47_10]|uniref:RiboL-PSP-HEPN domain-containing protein n=1 Tax=Candidatus Nomurabacteria bacterium GW2011_GWB1_47_6 TaxID=1618749 RepID=A0A0G1VBF1_9BACT|nr:MAG: hypothetical protein UX71_C0001G0104 [Parcubacteria group bacterium GW2011_GWA1_47_10]KKU75498.1 MAG: hypothetical protein UY01_C0011G0005 [Candidatus Nomurabacteria bacterium GW2011_GWB1_47_6]